MAKFSHKTLVLLLLLTLLVTNIFPCSPVVAFDDIQWTAMNIPTEGSQGKWTLASGSDVRQLTMANDGTLYCYANPSGTVYTLFKSIDSGRNWTTPGKVTDAIIDIATLPQDAATIYYATAEKVYKSIDAGNTFISLPVPGGAGSNNVLITSIDVVSVGNTNTVAVSTIDSDTSEYGGVYLLNEGLVGPGWVNTNIGNYDIYRVAFSPDYPEDRQLIAITSNETDTSIKSKIYTGDWGQAIGNANIPGIVPTAACVAFPDKYNGLSDNAVFFTGIDTGCNTGDVYKITRAIAPALSVATDLNIGASHNIAGVDIAGLTIDGNTILAGCAGSAMVYLTNDDGVNWMQCNKPPTGQTDTGVLMAPDFVNHHKVYAATSGTESGFSYSIDGGITWNQISLIDTNINDIPDFAALTATTVFMLTFNSNDLKHSLWRTLDGGITWDRIVCAGFTGIDNLKFVKSISQNGADTQSIIVAGQNDSNPVTWESNDNGRTFTPHISPCAVDTWAIVDSSHWFIGGYDGSKGLIYYTANGGNSYITPSEVRDQQLTDIVLSPNYPQDKTILAGNTIGQVYLSEDNGVTFRMLGQQLPLISGIGRTSLAFDSKFSENKVIYAASDAKVTASSKERIFRFTLNKSTRWQSICTGLPDNSIIEQIAVNDDGTLYGVNIQSVLAADKKGGIVRSLNPTSSSPAFETISRGLDDTDIMFGVSIYGHQLWSIDTKFTRLMTFNDTLTTPVILISPTDKASGLGVSNLNLNWQTSSGATEYEWQVSNDNGFTGITSGQTGTCESSSARPAGLEAATTYYWRVRVSKPFLSPWSDAMSFNTILGGNNIVPILSVPAPGAVTNLKPVFQWGTIASASKYDLLVATDASFQNIVIDKTGDNALPGNAWESDINLNKNVTYYWKVRACSENSFSDWSAVNVFTTDAPLPDLVLSEKSIPATTTTVQIQQVMPLPTQTQIVTTQSTLNVNVNIPPLLIYGGIALLAIIVITLTVLAISTIRRRH